MAWIESHQELREHPKTKRLCRLLAINRREAVGLLHFLWWWAYDYASEGDLSTFSDDDIADAVDWEGDAAQLVDALVQAGFVDADRQIHDWEEFAEKWIERRRANAERMRAARAARNGRTNETRAHRVQRTTIARAGATGPDLTGPDLTGPTTPQPPPQAEGEVVGVDRQPEAVSTVRAVPKPTKLGQRTDQVRHLVEAAGVPIAPTRTDAAEVDGCPAEPELIAEAYVAAYRGEWDPGGSGWLRDSLSLRVVVGRIAGYQASRGRPPPARNGRHGGLSPPDSDLTPELRARIAKRAERPTGAAIAAPTTTET